MEPRRCREPVQAGHLDVQQDHVRPVRAGERDGLVPVARLGDHLDVRVPGQDGPHPRPDHRFVVGDQHPDRATARCRLFHAASLRPKCGRADGGRHGSARRPGAPPTNGRTPLPFDRWAWPPRTSSVAFVQESRRPPLRSRASRAGPWARRRRLPRSTTGTEELCDHPSRTDQALRRDRRRRRSDTGRQGWSGDRLPRSQRRRQVDHDAHDSRPGPSLRGRGAHRRQAVRIDAPPGPRGRRAPRRQGAAPGPLRPRPPRGAGAQQRHPGAPGGRGAGDGRPGEGGAALRRGVLPRHVPAARRGGRTARRPAGTRLRRAGQRPRPRRCPLGA